MKKRPIALLLLLCLTLPLLFGCQGDKADGEGTVYTTKAPDPNVYLFRNSYTGYCLVLTDTALYESQALLQSLSALNRSFVSLGGDTMNIYVPETYDADMYPDAIFLSVSTSGLRLMDYSISINEEDLLIKGGSPEALIHGVDAFRAWFEEHAPGQKKVIFSPEDQILFRHAYKAEAVTVGDGDLKDCTIVLSQNPTAAEHQFAYRLREAVATHYGYLLPVKSDERSYPYELLVGNTARSSCSLASTAYEIGVDGGRVTLSAGSTAGYTALETLFAEKSIASGAVTSVSLDLSNDPEWSGDSILGGTGDIRIISQNILSYNTFANLVMRWDLQLSIYTQRAADFICLQEFNHLPRENAKGLNALLLAAGYREVPFTNDLGGAAIDGDTPIYYNPEKFELLQHGVYAYAVEGSANITDKSTSRTAICGIFKDKSSGRVFLLVSTHLDDGTTQEADRIRTEEAQALLQVLEQRLLVGDYKELPVILVGDFNSSYTAEESAAGPLAALQAGGYTDVQSTLAGADNGNTVCTPPTYDADTNRFTVGTVSGVGKDAPDHCLYRGGLVPTLFDVVDDPYARMSSDHMPIVVDFRFS